jgi:hypothetical protein
MITTDGKNIIGKFLVGQAPAYASYIAIGTGHNPSASSASGVYTSKSKLDFEIFRVPITSRSYFVENGISKVVFGAELPTQDRFYFTEAGVYSSGTNPIATASDSRILYNFSEYERWERHETTSPYTFAIANSALTADNSGNISSTDKPVFLNNTDPIFENAFRVQYKEQPRFLESSVAIPGGYSALNTTGDKWTYTTTQHIHLTNQSFSLDNNSPSDTLTLAFSILKRVPGATNPDVDILIEFSGDETEATSGEYAQLQIEIRSADYSSNGGYRYFTKSSTIGEMNKSETFSWNNVKIVKVFVQASDDDATIVAIDGLRFENNFDNIANPLYGMVAYSPIYNFVTPDYLPILKEENSKNLVEINFDIELGDGGS